MRIRKVVSLSAILALAGVLGLRAADWLNNSGEAQASGLQKHEKILTTANVKDLKLIWKLKLDKSPVATPAILGHWVTNRGTKELVFAVTGSNNVYAIDADLGRLFWQRHLEDGNTANPMPPSLAPGPPPPPGQEDLDDDDDVRQEIRPVYVTGSSGRRYRLHPTTGLDLTQGSEIPEPAARGGSARVIANAVVYVLSRGTKPARAVLSAYEEKTGRQLYSSGNSIQSLATASGLAIANGHVCFGTQDGTLYCFGFPVDQ